MNATHTPGDWHATPLQDGRFLIGYSDGFVIATLSHVGKPGETEANARLIAAAPKVLASLRRLEAAVTGLENSITTAAMDEVSAAQDQARALIRELGEGL